MAAGDTDWDELAGRLGTAAVADGEPTRWYDELWAAGARSEVRMPWDRTDPHDLLASFTDTDTDTDIDTDTADGRGRRAAVIGAGYGADAEFLAARGWRTMAFDISPAAVAAAKDRYPQSTVEYRLADLLELPEQMVGAFDLVVEIFTVQALHPSLRDRAVAGVRRLLAPGGRALVVQMVREDDEPVTESPPWRLDRAEMSLLAGDGLSGEVERVPHVRAGARDRWRLVLTRH